MGGLYRYDYYQCLKEQGQNTHQCPNFECPM